MRRSRATIRIPALALVLGACGAYPGAPPARGPDSGVGTAALQTSLGRAARPHFLRGVAALHNFWYAEAAAAFREAQRVEPAHPMPYWGEAMSYVYGLPGRDQPDSARAVLARLAPTPQARAAAARTERERAYLGALEALIGAGSKGERQQRFAAQMEQLSTRNPRDDEAVAFHAGAVLMSRPFAEWDLRLRAQAAARAEEVLSRQPDHPGALHYLIHAYDHPELAVLGLRAAPRYARVAPASPHALHMPSHIFVQMGRWPEAEASNRAAYAASDAWVREDPARDIGQRDYHALAWLQYAVLQQGRVAEAAAIRDTMAAVAAAHPSGYTNYHVLVMSLYLAGETGEWEDRPLPPGRASYLELFRVGMGAVAAGDTAKARQAMGRIAALADSAATPAARRPIRLAERQLAARTALRNRDFPAARAAAEEVVRIEEETGATLGPPLLQPARELLGDVLRAAGEPLLARAQYEQALLRTPNRRRSLAGALSP